MIIILEGNNFVGKSVVENLLAKKLTSTIEIQLHDFRAIEKNKSVIEKRYLNILHLLRNEKNTDVIIQRFILSELVLVEKNEYHDFIVNELNEMGSILILLECDLEIQKTRIDKTYPTHLKNLTPLRERNKKYSDCFYEIGIKNKFKINTNKPPEEVVEEILEIMKKCQK